MSGIIVDMSLKQTLEEEAEALKRSADGIADVAKDLVEITAEHGVLAIPEAVLAVAKE